MSYTSYKRFGKALVEWAEANADIVALTGHVSGTDERIWIKGGGDIMRVPSLLFDIQRTDPFMGDVDTILTSTIYAIAIGRDRSEALAIIGAFFKHAAPSSTTYKDASFSSNYILTKSIMFLSLDKAGESEFDIDSVRRTERSDTPIPERNIALMPMRITWMDTS